MRTLSLGRTLLGNLRESVRGGLGKVSVAEAKEAHCWQVLSFEQGMKSK